MSTEVLHGTWLAATKQFFFWGESAAPVPRKGRQPKLAPHPFASTPAELHDYLGRRELAGADWQEASQSVWLPSSGKSPVPSPELLAGGAVTAPEGAVELRAWQLHGLVGAVGPALDLLLALGSVKGLGDDLRAWHLAALLALEVVAAQEVVPALLRDGYQLRAVWRPRPSAERGQKLAALARALPPLARAVVADPALAGAPRALLDDFVGTLVDTIVRELPFKPLLAPSTPGGKWLAALLRADALLALKGAEADELFKAWQHWSRQEFIAGDDVFRVTFRLEPPESTKEPWSLSYLLQATDDPSLLVAASSVWREKGQAATFLKRRFEQPQERLLTALGYAARLFPPIETSLKEAAPARAQFGPAEAFSFLKEAAPLLEQSGFGVMIPAWWNGKGARLQARGRAKASSAASEKGRLSLATLVDFNWEITLGDAPINRAEFERLVALKMPLVQVRGQWVVLDPEHLQQALSFFGKHDQQMPLLDAMQMLLDPEAQVAPQGVEFGGIIADGWLAELLEELRDTQQLDIIPEPQGLQGKLRPYQQRGYSWLAFLRRVGFGACLADDMGLGKCIGPDSLVGMNGRLIPAHEVWQKFATNIVPDQEGFWATPAELLSVNALDETTGRIVPASVERLYRQYVKEQLRIIELEDGNSIKITRQHQLLTRDGWTNHLKVGDYVCVPARLPWVGEPQDHDLVCFLAWQIAEGHERTEREVNYCKIKAIRDIDYEGWVYDLEIGQHHNFVANNILCHNTIQTITLLLHEREELGATAPALLVCPTSVVGNWVRELERFAPSLRVAVHHGPDRKQGADFQAQLAGRDVVLTSYPLLARDRATLSAIAWGTVVLDEAQNIKNASTRQAQAARSLQPANRVALTGTPVENRLSELWSIMTFLNPGYLGTEAAFRRDYARPIERTGDQAARERLRKLTGPFILRRLKTDKTIITDLPDKMEMKVYCSLTREQATLYQATVEDFLRKIQASEGIDRRGLVLAMLMRLKQICNHPAQYLQDGSGMPGRSGKLARLVEMLEEVYANNDRALIFTQFSSFGAMLQTYLAATFYDDILFLHGGTAAKDRDAMVRRFQAPDGPRIFILSLKAGGTGLNLTSANHVFHYDRWWNPAVENQATDRAFRIGQTRNVQVHKFLCGGTLEDHIDAMIESKRELAASVIGDGEGWLTELSTDQLRDLVTLRQADIEENE